MGMNFNPTQEDIDSWMQMTDLDGDGKVNLEDYERLIISSLEKCGIRIYEREWSILSLILNISIKNKHVFLLRNFTTNFVPIYD